MHEIRLVVSLDSRPKARIKSGRFFICVVCNRCLYKKSVSSFKMQKYSVNEGIIFAVRSFDGNVYICETCDEALQRNSIPCQAVANKLNEVKLLQPFQSIRRLERMLVSRRIWFRKDDSYAQR